jgi:beta-glucan synthesis-associated protein KRE6
VNVSFPSAHNIIGLWPAAWTHGNLLRPGYGATADGMWPYSYEACDTGTFPNQISKTGVPTAAKHDGDPGWGGQISFLDGQRASACTCPGEDHPGPNVNVGRGGPEIDIFEAQAYYFGDGTKGSVSQSIQIAPMDGGYHWNNVSGVDVDYYNTTITRQNPFSGRLAIRFTLVTQKV